MSNYTHVRLEHALAIADDHGGAGGTDMLDQGRHARRLTGRGREQRHVTDALAAQPAEIRAAQRLARDTRAPQHSLLDGEALGEAGQGRDRPRVVDRR